MDKITRFKQAIFGLRKLSFAAALLVTTTSLVISDLITGSDFARIWTTAAPALFAASLIEDIVELRSKNAQAKTKNR